MKRFCTHCSVVTCCVDKPSKQFVEQQCYRKNCYIGWFSMPCVICVCENYPQVMTAASYWSLLAPAIDAASQSGSYGKEGQWAFIPVAIGFILGAAFVYGADSLMPMLVRP